MSSKRAVSIYTLTNTAHFPIPLLGFNVASLLNCSYLTDATTWIWISLIISKKIDKDEKVVDGTNDYEGIKSYFIDKGYTCK